MTTFAHISDLHLNGSLDRHRKLRTALQLAEDLRADHLVVTGDVTATSRARQLEELLDAIDASPIPRTIVLGNHDWRLPAGDSTPIDFGDALLVPVDTRVKGRAFIFGALGKVGKAQFAQVEALTRSGKPTILAMHHGPQPHPLHAFDGLVDRGPMQDLLRARPWVSVLAGHDHRILDVGNVHTAAAVAHHPDPLRVYAVSRGTLVPTYRSFYIGKYFS